LAGGTAILTIDDTVQTLFYVLSHYLIWIIDPDTALLQGQISCRQSSLDECMKIDGCCFHTVHGIVCIMVMSLLPPYEGGYVLEAIRE
jgi:hypothetical protein